MIQFNLLPDVKLEYIKAQRTRRLVTSISFIASLASVILLVLVFAVGQLQKKHLSDLNKDIKRETAQLRSEKDLSKVLTVQNQLSSLTGLHAQKPAVSQVFSYLNQLTPNSVSISSFSIDTIAKGVVITGNADTLNSVNAYVDTLKYTTYTTTDSGDAEPVKAFSDVVLTGFGLSSDTKTGKPATYSLSLLYDPVIFDITQTVRLTLPNTDTLSRKRLEPGELFQQGANATPAAGATTGGTN